jgi:hypothetical protein
MKTRVTPFFQQGYVPTLAGDDAAESRSRRSTADYQYVRSFYSHGVAGYGQLAN